MYFPTNTLQDPIQCDTIPERDSLLNDPRYRIAGLSVSVNTVIYWLNADLITWSPQGQASSNTSVTALSGLATRYDTPGTTIRQLDARVDWRAVPTGSAASAVTQRAGSGVDYELSTLPNAPRDDGWGPTQWGNGDSDILLWLEADDVAVGSGTVQYWNDHRFYNGGPYSLCVQNTAGSRPSCSSSWNGEKWIDFDGDWMQMPSSIATALTSATGFGAVFMLFLCRSYQPASNYLYQNLGGSAGVVAGGQRGYCYIESAVTGGNTATITRRGIAAQSMAAETRYFGAMQSHVEGLLFGPTQFGVFCDGLVAYASSPASFTSGSNCLGQSSGYTGSIRSVVIAKGVPTINDLLRFERWLHRKSVRKVLFDGNSILGNIISGPPAGSFPWYTEQALGARYSVENRGIPSQTTAEVLARFDQETAPRLRRGDAYALHELGNSLANADDVTTLAQAKSICDKVKAIGAIPLVCTILPRTSYTTQQNTYRESINAALKANPLDYSIHATGIVRFDEVTEALNPASTTYYVDGVHPTDALHAVLGPVVAAPILALAPV